MRRRLLAAVDAALAEHRDEIERQHRELERAAFAPSGRDLRPSVSLKFALSGVGATVRYPVDLRYAAEIDEAVSRELLGVLNQLQRTGAPAPAGSQVRSGQALMTEPPEIRVNTAPPS